MIFGGPAVSANAAWGEGDTMWWKRTAWKLSRRIQGVTFSPRDGHWDGCWTGRAYLGWESCWEISYTCLKVTKKQREGGGSRNFCKFSVNHGKIMAVKSLNFLKLSSTYVIVRIYVYYKSSIYPDIWHFLQDPHGDKTKEPSRKLRKKIAQSQILPGLTSAERRQ